MADHQSYEESIKKVYKGLWLLAGVTLIEVIVSLFGKGHLGGTPSEWLYVDFHFLWLHWQFSIVTVLVGLGIIVLSLYKAYFIIYEFMHMKYEVKTLATTVLLPTALLIWAVIAFFQEGNSWKERRSQIKQFDEQPASHSSLDLQEEIYQIKSSDI